MVAYDAYVELRGRRLRGDPDREASGLPASLARRRAKLAGANDERDSLCRALQQVAGRGEEVGRLSKERGVLAGRFSTMRGMGLRHLPPPDRRAVYDALRMAAHADENSNVSITGIFGDDTTGLLPMSWAVAKAGARGYDVGLNTQLPTPHKGVVSVGHPRRGRNIYGDAGGGRDKGRRRGDVAECRIGGFGPLVNLVGR